MTNKLILASALAGVFALVSRGEPRNLVWTGAVSSHWNTTAENWYVAGDAEKTPVAFQSGDNVLFDDSAASYSVTLVRIDAVENYQFDIGNVVFSNETQNYTFDADGHNWIYQRGGFGTIDKWGAARVDVLTRLDTAKNFTCHQGEWKCRTGSNYVGEFRSCLGSLHDARTVTFEPGSCFNMNSTCVLGAPTSAKPVSLVFNGASVTNSSGSQNMGPVCFTNSSYYGSKSTFLYFTGDVTVGGEKPFLLNGWESCLTVCGNNAFRTVTVADVTGDDGYDMVVSNKLADTASWSSGSTVRLMNRLCKRGTGTLAFMNNDSTTTGVVDIAEGTVAFDFSQGWKGDYSSVVGRIDGPNGAHAHVIVRDGATVVFPRSVATGEMNNPMSWELSVSNATLRLGDKTYQQFGTLRLHNAVLDWQNAYQNSWINYDFIGCSDQFVLSGDTPYVFEAKGVHPSGQGLADNCTFRLGFRLDSLKDDHPIAEAGTDPAAAAWTKYAKFTNMWTVVDFVVEDITNDDAADATMGWTIKDMPNMSYTSLNANETWSANPWKNYRFRGGIRKAGKGTFRTTGKNSYTHTTEVAEGTLVVDGTVASSSGLTVDAGAYLGGTGTVCAVTVKANGGFAVDVGKTAGDVLKVPSLVTEGTVVVRLTDVGKTGADFSGLKVLQLTNKPQTVDLSQWKVVESNGRRRAAFANYDPQTGVVSLVKSGLTIFIR